MGTRQMKEAIIKELNKADEAVIKGMYGVLKTIKQDYKSAQWDELTKVQKQKIETGLQQLKEGKGVDAFKATNAIAKKYGIKG